MLDAIFVVIYLTLLFLLARCDWRSGLLPDRFTCPLLWSGLLYHLVCMPEFLCSAVWGAIAGYLFLLLVYWLYRFICKDEGMGYGDIKFLSALGAWHGWQMLTGLLFIASLGGCIAYLLAPMLGRLGIKIKVPLPFGSFMAVAALISVGCSYYPPIRAVLMPLL